MIHAFENLSLAEQDQILNAPAYITALVAGSDGTFDEEELAAGTNLAKWKTINARPDLLEYYQLVDARFAGELKQLMQKLPDDTLDRGHELVAKIKELNPILAKLEITFAEQIYASWKELAKRIAEASGGVLGYLSIGYDESKVVNLEMLKSPRSQSV
jgi:hypothetical protein